MVDDDRLDALENRINQIRRAERHDGEAVDVGHVAAAHARRSEYQVVADDDAENGDSGEHAPPPDRYEIRYAGGRDDGPLSIDALVSDMPMADDGTVDLRDVGFNSGPSPALTHPDAPDAGTAENAAETATAENATAAETATAETATDAENAAETATDAENATDAGTAENAE